MLLKKSPIWSEKGLTLIELALGLSLMAIILAGITAYRSTVNEELQLRNDAKYLNVVLESASSYLEYERNNILQEAIKSGAFPYIRDVTLQTLKDNLYLPNIVNNTFGQGRTVVFRTRVDKSKFSPGGYSVQGMLLTRGITQYTVRDLGTLANMVNGLPGFIDRENPDTISGVNGSWQYSTSGPLSDWPIGTFENGQLVTIFHSDNAVSNALGMNQRWQSVPDSGVNNTDKTIMIMANADFIIPWFLKIGNAVGTPIGIFPGSFCLSIDVGNNQNIGETCISNNVFDYKVTTKALVPPGESYHVHVNKYGVVLWGSPRITQVFALR